MSKKDFFNCLNEDGEKNPWIGTLKGLNQRVEGKFEYIDYDDDKKRAGEPAGYKGSL
jgi:hypothetical protein